MIRVLLSVLFAVVMTGCASVAGTGADPTGGSVISGPVAQRSVYAVRDAYAVAQRTALAYESQPRCSATQTQPCSDPALVDQIRKANTTAVAALDAAEAAVRTPQIGTDAMSRALQTANSALAAFSALLPLLGVPR